MVYRLRPLELTVDFEDRSYRLGETIDIAVELESHGDVDVREARVDFVCEQRYVERPPSSLSHVELPGYGHRVAGTTSFQPGTEKTEKYTHSRTAFLKDARLRSAVPTTYRVKLRIQADLQRRADDARALTRDAHSSWTFKWRLVTTVDVVRGRNPRRQRQVDVVLE